MPALTFRVGVGQDGNFAALTETDQAAASRADGWVVGKGASGLSSEFDVGIKQAAGTFSANSTTAKPASFLTGATANACKTQNAYRGTLAATAWTLTFAVRAVVLSAQAGRMRCRVFASQNADGSAARELTAATQVGTTSSVLSTTVDVTTVVTWTPAGVITLNNEYLFFVLAWEITTASGSNTGDVVIRTGQSAGGSRFVTSNFVSGGPVSVVAGQVGATSTVSGSIRRLVRVAPAQVGAASTVSGTILVVPAPSTASAFIMRSSTLRGGGVLRGLPVTTAALPYRTEVLADSPIAYWRFGEASDLVAKTEVNSPALDGGYNGSAILGRPAAGTIDGTAVEFDGVDDYVNVPASSLHDNLVATAWTLETWIYPTAWPSGGDNAIFCHALAGSGLPMLLGFGPSGQLWSGFWGLDVRPAIGPMVLNTWQHVAATWNGTTMRLYRNGVEVASGTGAYSGSPATGQELRIGLRWDSAYKLAARLDEAALYPIALSPARVLAHYTAGTAAAGQVVAIVPATIAATSAVSGAIRALRAIRPAQVSAASTVSGAVRVLRAVIPAQISAASTLSGSVRVTRRIAPVSVAATSTVVGSLRVTRRIAPASVSAFSTVSGAVSLVTAAKLISGTVTAASTVSGGVQVTRRIVPTTVSATSTVAGSVRVTRRITAANIAATSTVAGSVRVIRRITAANVVATSLVSGAVSFVTALKPIAGTVNAVSTVSGSIRVTRRVAPATVAATSTVAGSIRAIRRIAPANIAAASTVSGAVSFVTLTKLISGTVTAASTVSGSVRVTRRITAATVAATATVSGLVSRFVQTKPVSGVVTATSTVTGTLRVVRRVTPAVVAATSAVSGNIRVRRAITPGVVAATSTVSGNISFVTFTKFISGTIVATSTVSGGLRVVRAIRPASITATATVSGIVRVIRRIAPAFISATSSLSGHVVVRYGVRGNVLATSTVGGQIKVRLAIRGGNISAFTDVSGSVMIHHRQLFPEAIEHGIIVTGDTGHTISQPAAGELARAVTGRIL